MSRLRLALALLLTGSAAPLLAQSRGNLDTRVERVERELRAVQRKVFPSGTPAFSEPEIGVATPVAPPPLPGESGAGLNALTARVDALEAELQRTTGQIEQIQNRLNIVSQQAAKDRGEFDARLKAIEVPPAPAAAPGAGLEPGDEPVAPPAARPAPRAGRAVPAPRAPFQPTPPPIEPEIADTPAPRATATTGDPAEDGYMAGYALWEQKKYADAEAALKRVVQRYPKHRRASYSQNLLGRAYLDDGQPASAAEAFAANYQTNPRGERAPDSLYYLGQALIQLKKPADACRVYDELNSAYGTTLSASLKTRTAAARREAKCK